MLLAKAVVQNILTGEEFTQAELLCLLSLAEKLKQERLLGKLRQDLAGKNLALVFEKPSLRTRLSFTLAMQELGGTVVETISTTRKSEEPEDLGRVLGGYSHAIMLRTHAHSTLERLSSQCPVPVINGLSDSHHPCQVLADLLTLKQSFQNLKGLHVAYIGDGNNMLHSLMLLLPYLGIHLRYACPEGFMPDATILEAAQRRAIEGGGSVQGFLEPVPAIMGANAVYTDVWTSMGFEAEQLNRKQAFQGYQLNESLYSYAAPGAVIMHCMPMVRGEEITAGMIEHPCSVIFRQSENRLHAQKALLLTLLGQ